MWLENYYIDNKKFLIKSKIDKNFGEKLNAIYVNIFNKSWLKLDFFDTDSYWYRNIFNEFLKAFSLDTADFFLKMFFI